MEDTKIEDLKKKKTFSGDIIQRMMSDVEFEAFWRKYKSSKIGQGMRNRFQVDRPALSDTESKFLYDYFNDTERSMSEIAEKYGFEPKQSNNLVARLIMRAVWINKEKLGF